MSSPLSRALALAAEQSTDLLAEAIRVAEIPAPPFEETERSRYIAKRFAEVGLVDVATDRLGSVTGRRPAPQGSPRVMVIAHIDTVFPIETDVKVRIEGDTAFGPGLGDNSVAVANLISLNPILSAAELDLPCDLILAAGVGEEGLGDLRGVRQLMADWQDRLDAVIVYDGGFGWLINAGVASRRFKVVYRAEGGHSWGNFGNASAINGLVTACDRFKRIAVPVSPKTTLNVGTFHGGTSINAIPESAEVLLDMRSIDQQALDTLVAEALTIFEQTAVESNCDIELTEVGNRPGGQIAKEHPLVLLADSVLREMGREPHYSAGSTDANVPLSLGIPAICIGASNGGFEHTVREFVLIPSIVPGMQQLIRVLVGIDRSVIR